MKKFFCFLLCIFILCGCENKKEVENKIPDFIGFKTDVITTMNDVKINAKAKYESFGKLVLTFSLPESVNGMEIVLENGEYTVAYDGLTLTLSENVVPFSMVCEMVKVCANSIKSAALQDDCYIFLSNGHIYKLTTDEQNNFLKLTVDETYIIDFENFEYIMGHTE